MSIRSALQIDRFIPGIQDLESVLISGDDAGGLDITNLNSITAITYNGVPLGTQTLGQTLTNGNEASKNINMDGFALTNVSSINGFSTNRNSQGEFIAQQTISATLNTDFTIALTTPISLDIGTYIANIKINLSDVTATTSYIIYLYLNDGVTDDLLTSSFIDSASAINGVSLTIPAFPVAVTTDNSILTLRGRVNTTSSVIVAGFGDSYINCALIFVGAITPPNPPIPVFKWTWSQREQIRTWSGVASSSDGVKLLACSSGNTGRIYYSLDSGVTWAQSNVLSFVFTGVASSSDGVKGVAVADGDQIYLSVDSGANFVTSYPGYKYWSCVASSSDGVNLVAGAGKPDYIYTSTNSGVNWTQRTGAGLQTWLSVASNSTGTILYASYGYPYLRTSTDSGVNWIDCDVVPSGNKQWRGVATDSTGTFLISCVEATTGFPGYIYTSTDGGVTLIERASAGSRLWKSVASDSTGTNLVASVTNGYIYTSADGGVTWTQQDNAGSRNWVSVASDSTGTKIICADKGGYLYTGVYALS